jgi:hypothetical protein
MTNGDDVILYLLLFGIVFFLHMIWKELKQINYEVKCVIRLLEYRNSQNIPDMED